MGHVEQEAVHLLGEQGLGPLHEVAGSAPIAPPTRRPPRPSFDE